TTSSRTGTLTMAGKTETITQTGTTNVATAAVTPSATTVSGGSTFTVTVANGPGNPTDWVAMYGSNTSDMGGFVAWKYLNGLATVPATGLTSATIQFTAPTTAGTYNVRLFSNNTYTKLPTSATTTVTASACT